MRRSTFLTFFALIALWLPGAAAAQNTSQTDAETASEEVTVYDFKDTGDLTGHIVTPTESFITGQNTGEAPGLDFTRDNFMPELMKSVEQL